MVLCLRPQTEDSIRRDEALQALGRKHARLSTIHYFCALGNPSFLNFEADKKLRFALFVSGAKSAHNTRSLRPGWAATDGAPSAPHGFRRKLYRYVPYRAMCVAAPQPTLLGMGVKSSQRTGIFRSSPAANSRFILATVALGVHRYQATSATEG